MSVQPQSADMFDYVVVGAGAAGSVIANRLSADGRTTVCLLEAGPSDRNFYLHVPGGFIKSVTNPKYAWQFKTEPSEGTAGRRISMPQGKTLGGSTAINGLNYNRGQAADFDGWAQQGNRGWAYGDVLEYFKRTERRVGKADARFRGSSGLLPITDCDWRHPLCDAFISAAVAQGIPRNPDYNGETQAGVGYFQRWIEKGWRVSAARAFLRPAMRNRNLEIRTNAQATAILFEEKRARGVRYVLGRGSPTHEVMARREIILCSGAANTPKLLQLSGIGPSKLLGELGIPVLHDLPGVGANLRDHYMVRLVARVKNCDTINDLSRGARLLREIARWATGRPSILAISPSVAFGFTNSSGPDLPPDIQLNFTPGSYMKSVPGLLDKFPGMTLGFYQLRPESSGYVHARSADPFEAPIIQPNYLADEQDQQVAVASIKLMRRILAAPELQAYYDREESPGDPVGNDADLLAFARDSGNTAYHLMGTCRMNPGNDRLAVVDSELRVHGLESLRVADASIMPTMPSANTCASVFMIAEKAADMILGQLPIEPLKAVASA